VTFRKKAGLSRAYSVAAATDTRKHFNVATHHPVAEAMKHITSPLTASLLIFGVHKYWQRGAIAVGWLGAGGGRWLARLFARRCRPWPVHVGLCGMTW
jgi:hypothetical protein